MLIARASGFAMFNADMSGNARSVPVFLFPAMREHSLMPASPLYCRAFISSLGLTSCERL